MSPATRGVVVVLAGFGLTLALGSLYVLGVIATELLRPVASGGLHEWSARQVSTPFAVAAGCFVIAMVAGGALQDRIGPRWPSTAGGVLIGLGMIVASMSPARLGEDPALALFMILGLGIMVGVGAGLTFASVVPPAVKWSVPRRRGVMVGLALAGCASGPVWLNRSVGTFVESRGVSSALLVQGVVLLAVIVLLSQLLEDPLPGYVPPGSYEEPDGLPDAPVTWAGHPARVMLRMPAFYSLWGAVTLLTGLAALSALVIVIGGPPGAYATMSVAVGVALGGGLGGVFAGLLHDRIGQGGVWKIVLALAGTFAAGAGFAWLGQAEPAALFISASVGGGMTVAWISTIECFGLRHAGANFGFVFTGFGVGILAGALIALSVVGAPGQGPRRTGESAVLGVSVLIILAAALFLSARVRHPEPDSGRGHGATGGPHGGQT